jgi:hypothetical protein
MATLPLDVRPANPVHTAAAPAALPIPANDTLPSWTQDRRARVLLASMAANPPVLVEREYRYVRTSDRWCEYVGYRAEALEAVRLEHGERVHTAYMLDGGDETYAAFEAYCRQPTTTQAIDAVLVEG